MPLLQFRTGLIETPTVYPVVTPFFQFHAGSIEAVDLQAALGPAGAFQSHAGSIEAVKGPWIAKLSCEFQSHAGSIEACATSSTVLATSRFQSHAGSIEAGPRAHRRGRGSPVSIPRWFD
jgi:hypothetical protein